MNLRPASRPPLSSKPTRPPYPPLRHVSARRLGSPVIRPPVPAIIAAGNPQFNPLASDCVWRAPDQHRNLTVGTRAEQLYLLRRPSPEQPDSSPLPSAFNGFNRPAQFASEDAVGLDAQKRFLFRCPTPSKRGWPPPLRCEIGRA